MKVHIVSWGLELGAERVEIDAIVHAKLEDAQGEFDLVDLATVGRGAYDAAIAKGWSAYAALEEVEMLDEQEQPTDVMDEWFYDGERTLIGEKKGA